ncbi:MAG: hemin uptake protein HemP [Pseudomonadota bacterium]
MASTTGCRREGEGPSDDAFPPAWTPGGAVDSRLLLGTSNTVTIRHGHDFYTLRETRSGKLILTK